MNRWLPHPVLTPVLMGLWLLLNNTLAPGQIFLGLVLGWAIPRFTVNYWPDAVPIHRPVVMLRLLVVFLYDVVVANLAVARLILLGPKYLRPVFVEVPLEIRNPVAISMLANIICLTPGTVSADLSGDHRTLLVHALDADAPEAVARHIKARYEAPLREIFEC